MPRTKNIKDILKKINKKIATDPSRKQMVTVDGDRAFWMHNGPVLKNIEDFVQALKTTGDEQFYHHVTHEKNDFANWIEYVLSDPTLANKLRPIHTREEAIQTTVRHLNAEYGLVI